MDRLNGWKWGILTLLLPLVLADSNCNSEMRFTAMSAPCAIPSPRNVRCSYQQSSSAACAIHCEAGNCSLCTMSPEVSTDTTLPGQVYILDRKANLVEGIHLPMDEIVAGELVGDIPGTVISGCRVEPGIVGNSIYFDGVSAWINLGNHRNRCFGDLSHCSEGYTLAMWLRAGVKAVSNMYYFSSGGQTGGSHGVAWYRQGNTLKCIFKVETEAWQLTGPMEASVWYHFVTTWHPAKGARMYRDGVLVDMETVSGTHPYNPAGYNNVVLGAPNNVQDYFGEASIDDIISYEHTVDEEYVQNLYLSYFY